MDRSSVYTDRIDAGKRLGKLLAGHHGTDALVLGIPRGGVPVAATVAHRLDLDWNTLVTRKLPIPWNPEAGFGAIAADGTVVLNEAMVSGLQLSKDQIEQVAAEVQADIRRRSEFFARFRPTAEVSGRTVIIVDDGLASGYTMLAAVRSVRERNASKIIAAAPVASRSAAVLLGQAADECVFEQVSPSVPFAVADFYLEWRDLTDDDLIQFLQSDPHSHEPHAQRGKV